MPRPKTSGAGRLRKLECPCGFISYASRGAVIRHGLPFCACGTRLTFADLDDMLQCAPDHAHEHPEFQDYTRRYVERTVRAATHVPAERLRCGGCGAFVPAANTRHSCGFHNDIRGNRNHGGWSTGFSASRLETPF